MTDQQYRARVRYVIGPDGSPLTVADLPPKDTKRWVIRRKAEVVAAVRGGLLSLEEACDRYKLTVDEFLSWPRSIDRYGLPGCAQPASRTTASNASKRADRRPSNIMPSRFDHVGGAWAARAALRKADWRLWGGSCLWLALTIGRLAGSRRKKRRT